MCEALGCAVEYHRDGLMFASGGGIKGYGSQYYFDRADRRSIINCVTIDRPEKGAQELTPEQCLERVQAASQEAYLQTADYLRLTNREFDDINKDYNPLNIFYAGFTVGRYYVYGLEDFHAMKMYLNIYCNKYTGEIFAEKAGLPFVNVDKGFINVSWMYQ